MDRKVVKSGNNRLALVMTMIAIHSISEHHFPEINYNILLVMPFACFGSPEQNRSLSMYEWIGTGIDKKKKIIQLVCEVVGAFISFAILPISLSWLKTAFKGHDYSGGGNREIKVFILLLCIMIAVILLIRNVSILIAEYVTEKRTDTKNVIIAGFSFLLLAVVAFKTEYMIDQVSQWHRNEIAEESYVLGLVKEHAVGKLYVDTYPESYARGIDGISRSIFGGEDLVRFENVSVLVDRELDSTCFFSRGFLYLPISEQSGLYTNDGGVIKALEQEEYHLTGYYPRVKSVDMAYESSITGLPMTESGGVQISGWEHSLIYGPFLDIPEGKFIVTYNLKIDPHEYSDDYEVITLKINTYWGLNTIAQETIYRSFFDENGELSYEIPFNISSGKAVEFLAFAQGEQQIEIESIEYRNAPDYDTHFVIDKKGRKVREEYFNLDGVPLALSDGCFGKEFKYDRNNNAVVERYLDADGNIMLNSSGYAEIHREFDKNGLLTREEYFDLDDQVVNEEVFE
jgi:hypothetical protein